MRLRPRHVRTRLTLWYVAVLSAVLAVYIASTLLFMRVSLHRQLDDGLRAEFGHLADRLTSGPDGTVSVAGHADSGDPGSLAEVWSPSGELLYRSPRLGAQVLGRPASTTPAPGSINNLTLGSGTPLRVLSQRYAIGGRDVVVRVGVSEENLHHEWRELLTGIVFGLPADWVASLWRERGIAAEHCFDPTDPPRFESQAAYLKRRGLLGHGESRRLPEHALEPETLPRELWPE